VQKTDCFKLTCQIIVVYNMAYAEIISVFILLLPGWVLDVGQGITRQTVLWNL